MDERFYGPRVERYGVNLLDENDNLVMPLDGVRNGKVEVDVDRVIFGNFAFDMIHKGQPVDWFRSRFQPWVEVNGLSWPLGVFLPTSPKHSKRRDTRVATVACVDKMSVLDENKIEQTYSIAPGQVVTEVVRSLILQSGEERFALTPSDKTTRHMMVWDPGESILRICHDLLQHIGYQRLWCDGHGLYRIEPNVDPAHRPVSFDFIAGETAIHTDTFSRTRDILGVPNKVVLTTSSTDESPALVSVATNELPDHPYSYQARGRWVVRTYSGQEAADQATLDARAQQYLWTASNPVANWAFEHAVLPLEVFQVMGIDDGPTPTRAWVNSWSLTLEAGSLMDGVWQEIQEH